MNDFQTPRTPTRLARRPLTLGTTLIAAAVLAACGGGGGSDGGTGGGTATTSAVALSGIASKGLMANADVKVHPVAADGSVDLTTTLAATTTDAEGRYSLSFDATVSRPYVVRVSAKADGSTTHLDEVTGTAQPLPAGFSMRSVITPSQAGTVTTSASITPFSEMVVAAAERAGGGISAGNTAQAVSTVTQLLGFDPTAVSARPVGSAESEDEKKMAVMLAAVSQMASGGQLGCSGDDAGARTRCVVEALSASSSTSSLKLATGSGGTTVDVSGALNTALGTVLTTPKLSGSVPGSLLAGVVANLGCKDSGCTPATASGGSGSGGTTDSTATAIAAARLLFNEIRSDWGAMFSRGGASSLAGGAANVQAWRFRSAMEGVEVPVDMLVKDAGTMLMGVDLYNDLMAGRSAQTTRSRGGDSQGGQIAGACGLFTATDLSTRATGSADARVIGCRAVYRSSRSFTQNAIVTTEWVHGFTLEPQADGSFAYSSRARQRISSCNYAGTSCTVTANTVLQPEIAAATGRLVPTLDALGAIRGFTLAGDLPGGFAKGSNTFGSHHHAIALSGSIATAADGLSASSQSDTYAVSGTLKAYSDASTEIGTLTLRRGQLALSTLTAGGSPVGTLADLDLLWTTPGAEFEGTLRLKDVVLTRSGESWVPTFGQLSGALRTTSDGVSTEFLKGTLEARISGASSYDEREADSASNRFGVDLTLTGTVTAPQRPVLEFTLGTTMHSDQDKPDAVSFQYRTLVGGAPRMVVSGTATPGSDGSGARFMLREATSRLSLGWTGQPSSAELKSGDTLIGRIDAATRMLTFTDGSFVSLDIGL